MREGGLNELRMNSVGCSCVVRTCFASKIDQPEPVKGLTSIQS